MRLAGSTVSSRLVSMLSQPPRESHPAASIEATTAVPELGA
jgi:hypothetical protein